MTPQEVTKVFIDRINKRDVDGLYERPIGRELQVVIWKGGLALMSLPTDNPSDSLTKLRKIEDNIFRRVCEDGELGEKVVFEICPEGRRHA